MQIISASTELKIMPSVQCDAIMQSMQHDHWEIAHFIKLLGGMAQVCDLFDTAENSLVHHMKLFLDSSNLLLLSIDCKC